MQPIVYESGTASSFPNALQKRWKCFCWNRAQPPASGEKLLNVVTRTSQKSVRRVHCIGLITEKPCVHPIWLTAKRTSSKWHPLQLEPISGKMYQYSSQMAIPWVQPKPKTTREHTWHCNLDGPRNETHTTTEDLDYGANGRVPPSCL